MKWSPPPAPRKGLWKINSYYLPNFMILRFRCFLLLLLSFFIILGNLRLHDIWESSSYYPPFRLLLFLNHLTIHGNGCVTDFPGYVSHVKIHSGHLTRPGDSPNFPQQQVHNSSLRWVHFCLWLSSIIFFVFLQISLLRSKFSAK